MHYSVISPSDCLTNS